MKLRINQIKESIKEKMASKFTIVV